MINIRMPGIAFLPLRRSYRYNYIHQVCTYVYTYDIINTSYQYLLAGDYAYPDL